LLFLTETTSLAFNARDVSFLAEGSCVTIASSKNHEEVERAVWVKICGIRDELTADRVAQLGPDAIGLNFYPKSPRFVARENAIRIGELTGDRVQRIGVFVNQSAQEIAELVEACRLDAVQIHGDESATQIAEISHAIGGQPIYRAWRMDGDSLSGLAEHLAECHELGVVVAGCLIDSRVAGAYGGTGHTVPWDALSQAYKRENWPPLILAGGLSADNVAMAVTAVQPWGVDVASGVESSTATKDLDLVARFIENART